MKEIPKDPGIRQVVPDIAGVNDGCDMHGNEIGIGQMNGDSMDIW